MTVHEDDRYDIDDEQFHRVRDERVIESLACGSLKREEGAHMDEGDDE